MSQMRDNVRIRDNVESEEELLRLQDEFLASKPKAAATVIRSTPPTIISSSPTQLKNNVDEKFQKDIVILDNNENSSSKSIKGEAKSKKKKSIFSTKRQKSIGSSGGDGAQRFEIDLDQKAEDAAEQ